MAVEGNGRSDVDGSGGRRQVGAGDGDGRSFDNGDSDALGFAIVGVALVAVISHLISRPVKGVEIVSPALIAPLIAALYTIVVLALFPSGDNAFALAYVCGVLGTLIGADLTNLSAIKQIGAPIDFIGGAGTLMGFFCLA